MARSVLFDMQRRANSQIEDRRRMEDWKDCKFREIETRDRQHILEIRPATAVFSSR